MNLSWSYGMNTKILQKLLISRKKAKLLLKFANPEPRHNDIDLLFQHGRVEGQVLGLQ